MFRSTLLALFALPFVAFASEPVVAAPQAAVFQPQPIAVAGIKARRMDPEMIQVVEQIWTRSFPADFRVLQGTSLGKNAELARRCDSSRCVAEKLKGAGADVALRAEVARLGGTLYVDLALIDVATGSVEKRIERTCGAQEELLVKALREATFELLGASDVPAALPTATGSATHGVSVAPVSAVASSSSSQLEAKYTRIENPAKKKALYGTVGGALVATGGMLGFLIAGGSYDPTLATLSVAGMGLGLTAFTISGLVYVVTPATITKKTFVTVTPVTDGKTSGVTVAGRF